MTYILKDNFMDYLLNMGKLYDMYYVYNVKGIICFDIVMSYKDLRDHVYVFVEDLKDGFLG